MKKVILYFHFPMYIEKNQILFMHFIRRNMYDKKSIIPNFSGKYEGTEEKSALQGIILCENA